MDPCIPCLVSVLTVDNIHIPRGYERFVAHILGVSEDMRGGSLADPKIA